MTSVVPATSNQDEDLFFSTEQKERPSLLLNYNNNQDHQHRRISCSVDLMKNGKRQSMYALDELSTIATAKECAKLPVDNNGNPMTIMCSMLVKKIRSIDAIGSCVNGSFIFTLRWVVPHLIGKRVDVESLWRPKLSLINYDELDETEEQPWFYPSTGDVRQIIKISGNISNEQDLRYFPFDIDDMKLLFCIELGTGDTHARLAWDENYTDVKKMVPQYVLGQMKEWNIYRKLTSVRRLPEITNLTGSMTGIEVRINVSRKYTFYIAKIYTLLWLMTFSSMYVLAMTEGSDDLIDRAVFNERLNFLAALLLTSVSFLYATADSIPKLSYLTSFDWMVIHSFVTQSLMMFEAFVVFTLTKHEYSPKEIQLVDSWCVLIMPLQYVMFQVFLICYALCKRTQKLTNVKYEHIGVEPCLLKLTSEDETLISLNERWYNNRD
jgi:hypothetical protein